MNCTRYGATAAKDDAKFIDRTRIYVLPCANIKTMEERADHAKYWRDELKRLERLVKQHDLRDIADEDIADYRFMSEFANKTANILRLVQDTLRPAILRRVREIRLRRSAVALSPRFTARAPCRT